MPYKAGDDELLDILLDRLNRFAVNHIFPDNCFHGSVYIWWHQGAVSIRKTVLPGMAIPMLKIRRPNGRLIFNMEIAIRR